MCVLYSITAGYQRRKAHYFYNVYYWGKEVPRRTPRYALKRFPRLAIHDGVTKYTQSSSIYATGCFASRTGNAETLGRDVAGWQGGKPFTWSKITKAFRIREKGPTFKWLQEHRLLICPDLIIQWSITWIGMMLRPNNIWWGYFVPMNSMGKQQERGWTNKKPYPFLMNRFQRYDRKSTACCIHLHIKQPICWYPNCFGTEN